MRIDALVDIKCSDNLGFAHDHYPPSSPFTFLILNNTNANLKMF